MKSLTDRQLAANYMGAVAHLLGGRPGRHAEFIKKVNLILSAHEPHALQLLQFTETVRRTGRPVIWMHLMEDAPIVPRIGLVARSDEQVFSIEHCFLWSTPDGKITRLVPDNFRTGAFEFDGDLRLQHLKRPPARNLAAADKGLIRAYRRLRRLEAEQIERGETFTLPELAKAA